MRIIHTHEKLRTKKFVIQAVAATIYWIIVMTPFMLLKNPSWFPIKIFVGMNSEQYVSWLALEILIIPILGVLSIYFIRKFEKYFKKSSS